MLCYQRIPKPSLFQEASETSPSCGMSLTKKLIGETTAISWNSQFSKLFFCAFLGGIAGVCIL